MYQNGPRIIMDDSLILYLDAANSKSADGSSVWYDLSKTKSNLNKVGSPSLTNISGSACYRFTATSQGFVGTLNGTQPTTDLTIETWIYPEPELDASDRACLILISGTNSAYMSFNKSNLKMSNYWYGHANEGYWESGAAVLRGTWNSFACIWKYNDSCAYQWTNGIKTIATPTVGNAATGANITLGIESFSRQLSGGMAFVRVYNRALTDLELAQNFNATKGRFNL